MSATALGTVFPAVELTLAIGDDARVTDRWRLHDVVVNSYFNSAGEAVGNNTVGYTLDFDRIEWEHADFGDDGKKSGGFNTSWDFNKQAVFAGNDLGDFPTKTISDDATGLFLTSEKHGSIAVGSLSFGARQLDVEAKQSVEAIDALVDLPVSGGSSRLFNAITTGQTLGKAIVSRRIDEADNTRVQRQHEFDDVFLTSYNIFGQGTNAPAEVISLTYGNLISSDTSLIGGSTKTETRKADWDVVNGDVTGDGDDFGDVSEPLALELQLGGQSIKIQNIAHDAFEDVDRREGFVAIASQNAALPALLVNLVSGNEFGGARVIQRAPTSGEEIKRLNLSELVIDSVQVTETGTDTFDEISFRAIVESDSSDFGSRTIIGPDGFQEPSSPGNLVTLRDTGTVFVREQAPDRIVITPPFGFPSVRDDSATAISGVSTTIDVLANDTDPNNRALMVSSVNASPAGIVVNQGDHITFTPNADFTGTTFLFYRATNGTFDSGSEGVVSVTVSGSDTAIQLDNLIVDENDTGAIIGDLSSTIAEFDFLEVLDDRFEVSGDMLQLKEAESLDHEDVNPFDIDIRAHLTDGSTTAPQTFLLWVRDVNEFDPVVSDLTFNINESSITNSSLGFIPASDQDTSQVLTFSMSDPEPVDIFTIVSTTGELGLIDATRFDHEQDSQFTMTVSVADSGTPPRTSTATVTVIVDDFNEFDPLIDDATLQLDENSSSTAPLHTVQAVDGDSSQTHDYSITAGNINDAFSIDQDNGEISINDPSQLNHEENPEFTLIVESTDNGTPTRSDSATITITINDVNEPPVANAGGPYSIDGGAALQVDASASMDVDAQDELSFEWDFNRDGAVDFTTTSAIDRVEWSVLEGLNLAIGTQTIDLQVTDTADHAQAASASLTISDTFVFASNSDGAPKNLTLVPANGSFEIRSDEPTTTSPAGTQRVMINGSSDDDSLTADFTSGDPIPPGGLDFNGGLGVDTFVIGGSDVNLDLTDATTFGFSDLEVVNVIGNSPNTLIIDPATVERVTDDNNILATIADEDDAVSIGDGWSLTDTTIDDGEFIRILTQNGATLRMTGPHDWNNPANTLDVNANGSIEPQDVLIVINELNEPVFSDADRRLADAVGLAEFPGFFYDTATDGFATPRDALVIINFINDAPAPSAEGEAPVVSALNDNLVNQQSLPLEQASNEKIASPTRVPRFQLPTPSQAGDQAVTRPPLERTLSAAEFTHAVEELFVEIDLFTL